MFSALWTDRHGNVLEEVKFREQTTEVSMNTDAVNKLGAQMSVHEMPSWVKPAQHRVQLARDGVNLGLYRVASVAPEVRAGSTITHLTLVDPLSILDGQQLVRPFVVPAGANVVDAVASLIRSTGETRLEITPSSAVLLAPQVFKPADKTLLNVANELLGAIGYWGLRTGRTGKFEISPYVLPQDRPVEHEFISGAASLMVPAYNWDIDYLHVPNRFIAFCEGYEEDDPDLVGVAENRDPNSEFSFQARGEVWIDATDTVEASSQAEIDAIAARRLEAFTGLNQYIYADTAFIDSLWMDSRVRAVTGAGDVFDATVKELEIRETGLVSTTWKRVQQLG